MSEQENNITKNKKAFHDYHIEENYEAGIALLGWEIKSLRKGRVQLRDSRVILKGGEAFLFGALITPLASASTHVLAEPQRTRKLLLHQREIDRLTGGMERTGYTIVPLSLYWKRGRVKVSIALARGKKEFDKRADIKDRDWQRNKEHMMKVHQR